MTYAKRNIENCKSKFQEVKTAVFLSDQKKINNSEALKEKKSL